MRLSILFSAILVLLAIALMPLGIALAQQANPGRVLPDTVQKGETVDVTVNFTAPVDNFNAVGLTDLCPNGWNVQLDKTWCTPNAEFIKATGNKAEFLWYGPYDNGTTFTALYKVTVPDDASLGIYAFNGSLEYYVGPEGPYSENITGGSQIQVVGGGGIGLWWIIPSSLLSLLSWLRSSWLDAGGHEIVSV
jgi:hypothetical protein